MNTKKVLAETLKGIEIWEKEVEKYDFEKLLKKPSSDSWSLGQVYVHLINATLHFHLMQIEICLKSDSNQSEKKNFKGFMTYKILGSFPPVKIKVPDSETYTPKQPVSKAQIIEGLAAVKVAVKNTQPLIEKATSNGKVAHPGLSFLNAAEWFQLIEMHFRHHLRQKARIDNFLDA